jgi:DNA polymerase III delta prime subunit
MPSKLITMNIDENMLEEWKSYCKEKGLTRTELIKSSVELKIKFNDDIDKLIKFRINALEERMNVKFQRLESLLIANLNSKKY